MPLLSTVLITAQESTLALPVPKGAGWCNPCISRTANGCGWLFQPELPNQPLQALHVPEHRHVYHLPLPCRSCSWTCPRCSLCGSLPLPSAPAACPCTCSSTTPASLPCRQPGRRHPTALRRTWEPITWVTSCSRCCCCPRCARAPSRQGAGQQSVGQSPARLPSANVRRCTQLAPPCLCAVSSGPVAGARPSFRSALRIPAYCPPVCARAVWPRRPRGQRLLQAALHGQPAAARHQPAGAGGVHLASRLCAEQAGAGERHPPWGGGGGRRLAGCRKHAGDDATAPGMQREPAGLGLLPPAAAWLCIRRAWGMSHLAL